MISRAVLIVSAGLTCLLTAGASRAPKDARQAHGRFTGQVKPVLYVRDVEKSEPFYHDALGFEFQGFANHDGTPYYAEMLAGSLKFGLHEPLSDSQKARVGKTRLYFRVEDLAAHHARVEAWNANPGPIRETAWMDMFVVLDPDSNEIVFASTDPARHTSDPWQSHSR